MTTPQALDLADQVIKLVGVVPGTVWAGLVGAAVTLAGVFVTHLGTSKRLKLQLDHDAEQKRLDRLAMLRKDVYLRAGEQLIRTQQYLASLNARDPQEEGLADGLTDFLSLSAQICLIANDRTVRLLSELGVVLGEGFLELLPRAAPAHTESTKIRLINEEVAACQVHIDAALQSMRSINESGQPDPASFDALNRSIDFERGRLERLYADRHAAYERLHRANQDFNVASLVVMDRISEPSMDAQIALREEMGLLTDRDEARSQMAMARARMSRAAKAANAKIFGEVGPELARSEGLGA